MYIYNININQCLTDYYKILLSLKLVQAYFLFIVQTELKCVKGNNARCLYVFTIPEEVL